MTLSSNAIIEIITPSAPDAKTLHLLRRRIEEATEEAIAGVLAEFDIENQAIRAVSVEPIEVWEIEQ